MGLMAVHLILLAVNKVCPTLAGLVDIYADCLGALDKVSSLPPRRIPSRCQHSDILKNIMVNCSDLTFTLRYNHVRAHQDDHEAYHKLLRPAQLNTVADLHAKRELWDLEGEDTPPQQAFPLEPVTVFAGESKITSDTLGRLRYWAHRRLASDSFFKLKSLSPEGFEEVAWEEVYTALHGVPRLFQLWAAKQVTGVAGTNEYQARYKDEHDPRCPSCDRAIETCGHILHCQEEERVAALHRSIGWLDDWLGEVGTEPTLWRWLVRYARGRGHHSMSHITLEGGPGAVEMGRSQDMIGWRRFMEGMISREILPLQEEFFDAGGSTMSLSDWAQELVVNLLECTHGLWLYRNLHVHDLLAGAATPARKEEIQQFIEDQLDMGGEGLD